VDMMDMISTVKEKSEAGKAKVDEIEKMHRSTDEKLKVISDSISQLSYAKQLEDIKGNINMLSSDIHTLGGTVSAESPKLRENMETVRLELGELKQKVKDVGSFGSDIKGIEGKLFELESMLSKKEEKAVSELSQADKQKLQDLSQSLLQLNNEIKKMEKSFESYPSSDAQATTAIRQKLDSIETALSMTAHGPHQEPIANELNDLRAKINSLERVFEQKELDMDKKREAEMQIISELLRKIETDLNAKTKQMADNLESAGTVVNAPRYFEEFRKEVMTLGIRLSRIEDYMKKEKVADSSGVSDLRSEVKSLRREMETVRGMKINPEIISNMKERANSIDIPATKVMHPSERNQIIALKDNVKRTQELLPPSVKPAKEAKKGLENAEQRVDNILKEFNKSEESLLENREHIKKMRDEVTRAPLHHEDIVLNYVSRVSQDTPVKVTDIAAILNMDKAEVLRMLIRIRKADPTRIAIKNTSYFSKLLRREPLIIRLK
jgi:hypothetical protein